ncbi:MAG: NlpC/P60 family protein [Pseudomonadota bacterium]
MSIPIWVGHYIGLPFKEHGRDREGVDCWGLVRLVMAEQFGIALPSYATEYDSTEKPDQLAHVVDKEKKRWTEIAPGQEISGDVVVMRMLGQPIHVGMVIGDGRMLHILKGIDATHESYMSSVWKDRVTGFFRYAGR